VQCWPLTVNLREANGREQSTTTDPTAASDGEPNHGNNFIFQRTMSTNVETAHSAVNSQEAATISDQGTFLSNLLDQIMPGEPG
nr:hypothetical protein [Tanacetum cinerariifolium]